MAVIGSWSHDPSAAAVIPSAGWIANLAQIKTAINTIDLAQMNTNSVGTDQIVALAVTTAKLAADCVTGAKIADDAVNSEHYVDGSIDNQHLAGGITAAKLAPMFEAAQDDEVASDTVTETDWHDIVGSSVEVTLDVASDVSVRGYANVAHSTVITTQMRVVYATNGDVTQVGNTAKTYTPAGGNEIVPLACGGRVSNLAADTYTFKVQAKVNTGTATFTNITIDVGSQPHR